MLLRSRNLPLIVFAAAGLLLSVKADGRFPFPEGLSETTFQLLLLPYSIGFFCVVLFFFLKLPNASSAGTEARPPGCPDPRLAAGIGFAFQMMIFLILIWENKKYAGFGYHLNLAVAGVVMFTGAAALTRLAVSEKGKAFEFFLTAIAIFAAVSLISIAFFPLHPQRSDMLPLIQAACERFLAGNNPYTPYQLPHTLPLTYLPGLWMSYLPGVFVGLDPRVTNAVSILASMIVIYRSAAAEQKNMVACFCGAFLMIPYLLYRHEIYLGVFWLALSMVLYFESRNRWIRTSVFLGIAASMSQFAWILIPFFLIAIFRKWNRRVALISTGLCGVTASVIVLPFAFHSPDNFLNGVFAHWEGVLNITTINFSFFILRLLPVDDLKYLQMILVLILYWFAWRDRRREKIYAYATIALMLFVLFNSVIWVYFYLTVLLLMIFSLVQAQKELRAEKNLA